MAMTWHPPMVLNLLQRLKNNLGDSGWNKSHKSYMCEDAALFISRQHPRFPVNKRQVQSKIRRLKEKKFQRNSKQPSDSLYCIGTGALKESYLNRLYEDAQKYTVKSAFE